jgi:hypothetical protein
VSVFSKSREKNLRTTMQMEDEHSFRKGGHLKVNNLIGASLIRDSSQNTRKNLGAASPILI